MKVGGINTMVSVERPARVQMSVIEQAPVGALAAGNAANKAAYKESETGACRARRM